MFMTAFVTCDCVCAYEWEEAIEEQFSYLWHSSIYTTYQMIETFGLCDKDRQVNE